MAKEDFKRKLTAILSADVKGYSRLMGEDDQATVRTITAYRQVITEVVQKHRGRVVDSPGDNILAEFASVIDAVSSAVEIQEELSRRNSGQETLNCLKTAGWSFALELTLVM
jgi:adenylate cyclase